MTKSMTTRAHPLLGLDLDHGRLGAVVIRRSGSTLEIREQGGGPLAMDLLKNEPELVGQGDSQGARCRRGEGAPMRGEPACLLGAGSAHSGS